ncbi:alcohol dehydrogenase catalytic domain-containing protein [Nocardioides acrostichi]|uniref:Alcohol dehydrogenase catalytic domain-containing protein n=1 Tax=Nocardioides acrostichi TaxID=2784339 RepID=A0A930V0J1_9ACTN|nr:alcohol dehydrogenase catalytic domain-containing protein [Nocardioides acrostichi]MBF4161626.1 alcohol dehydrogenase catalytic domain-containing protein [Nocardioides acrostichi]
MRSVIAHGPGDVRVDDAPDPEISGPDGAIVAVEATAICGSDLHFYDGDLPFFPVALGHEAIGRIVEIGPQVQRFRVGDRVLVSSVAGCGRCPGCATLDPIRCHAGAQVFGSGLLPGAQSSLLAVPAADFQLLAVPEGIDDDAALLLTDNLATGWVGASRGRVVPGDTVVVLGLGAVGQCAARAALAHGAARVLAVDPVEGRRERAAAAGAVPLAGETPARVLEETDGVGADVVIDAVANNASLDTAFASVRAGGTVSVLGIHDMEPYPLGATMGVFRSVTMTMNTAPVQQTWPDLVPMLTSGRLDVSGIITQRFDLEQAAEAYAAVAARTADTMKVVLTVGNH